MRQRCFTPVPSIEIIKVCGRTRLPSSTPAPPGERSRTTQWTTSPLSKKILALRSVRNRKLVRISDMEAVCAHYIVIESGTKTETRWAGLKAQPTCGETRRIVYPRENRAAKPNGNIGAILRGGVRTSAAIPFVGASPDTLRRPRGRQFGIQAARSSG